MKIILRILALLLVPIGGYVLYQLTLSPDSDNSSPLSSLVTEDSTLPSNNFLAGVRGDSLGVVHLSKDKFQPLVNRFVAFGKQISESAVWKKMKLDQAVEQNVASQLEEQLPSDVSKTVSDGDQSLKYVKDLWTALSDVSVVVSKDEFQVNREASFPKLMFRVNFSSPELAKPFLADAQKFLEDPSRNSGGPKITVDAHDKTLYRFSGHVQDSEDSAEKAQEIHFGAARVNPSSIHYYLGATSDDEFTTTDSSQSLLNTTHWKKVAENISESAAVIFYGQLTTIVRAVIQGLHGAIPEPEGKEQMKRILDMMKASGSDYPDMISFGSVDVSEHVTQKFCSASSDAAAIEKMKNVFSKEDQLSSDSQMMRLINQNTVVALAMSLSSFKAMFEPVGQQNSFVDLIKQQSQDNPEAKEAFEFLEAWERIAKAGLRNAGLFMNTGMIPTSPDVFFYVDTEAGKAEDFLNILRSEFEKHGAQGGAEFKSEVLTDGSKKFTLTFSGSGAPLQMSGSLLDDSTILFASNEMSFGAGSQALLSTSSYLSTEAGAKLAKEIDGSSSLFLMSTRPVIQLAAMFQGFVQGEIDKKGITNEEVEEMKSHLSFDYVNVQHMNQVEDGVACTVSKTMMFQ